MKRIISLTLCLALLFCLCSFSGCEKDEALSATGEYNGQKITMTYKVTDITYPWDMRGIHMSQGYAIYYDHTWLEEHPHASYDPHVTDAWNMIDQNGTPMIEEPYLDLMSFNSEGKTVARKQDGTYVSLNTKLKETPISYEEWLAFSANPENNPRLDAETIKIFDDGTGTSYVYEGLAIYVEPGSDKIMRAGLMDRDKNVIIPAFIPVCYSAMIETLYLFEDVAFVEDYETNKIGIVTVTRTPTNTENLTVLADEENYRVEMTEDQKFVYFYIRDNAGKVLEDSWNSASRYLGIEKDGDLLVVRYGLGTVGATYERYYDLAAGEVSRWQNVTVRAGRSAYLFTAVEGKPVLQAADIFGSDAPVTIPGEYPDFVLTLLPESFEISAEGEISLVYMRDGEKKNVTAKLR